MVKKLLFLFLLATCLSTGFSQNIQLHFDPRPALYSELDGPNFLTSTVEMFKPDKWGSTFFFVDFNYNQTRGNIGLAYWEIARAIKIGNSPIMAHVEYNGGVGNADMFGFSIANAYLAGAEFNYPLSFGNIGTYVAYKYIAFEKVSHDIQWTVTWGMNFFDKKITFSGFFDLWTENKDWMGNGLVSGKRFVMIAEPQIWYNVNEKLALGSEIEITNNFYYSNPSYRNKVYILPTLAAKWTF